MTTEPVEARCDHCQQLRLLCDRDTQPLLCAPCRDKERLRAAQAESDRAMCEGIAEATRLHTGGAP
jgi:hypothetical protein